MTEDTKQTKTVFVALHRLPDEDVPVVAFTKRHYAEQFIKSRPDNEDDYTCIRKIELLDTAAPDNVVKFPAREVSAE
jgi:hypothetical protein